MSESVRIHPPFCNLQTRVPIAWICNHWNSDRFLSQLPSTPAPLTQPDRPHRIQITLSDPSELQVSQGQVVQLGDILVVHSAERIQLETRRLKIQAQLLALENTPPPDTIVLQQRILAYQQSQSSYDQQYRLITHLQASEIAPSLMRKEIPRLQDLYSDLLTAHSQAQQAQLQHQQNTNNYRQEQTTQHQVLMGHLQIINPSFPPASPLPIQDLCHKLDRQTEALGHLIYR